MLRKRFAVLAALLALLALAGCEEAVSEANVSAVEKAVEVSVSTVEPVSFADHLRLPGATLPDKDVSISAESAGTVTWLGIKEGDRVEQRALLARVDVSTSGARFDSAKASRKLAAEQLRRRRELLGKGVLAQEEFDQMEAELARTEASLREMQVVVDYGVVTAPISGVINTRYVDRGERLDVGDKVVDIVDPSIIRVTINVPEMDIPYLHTGQEVDVTVDAIPDRSWKGEVDFVSFTADTASRTFRVRVLVDNADGSIRAGMLARVSLLRRVVENAVTVPLYAIINQGGERLIYVEENGVARARTIEIGVVEKDRAQVLSGLAIGENLIIAGHTMVEDGMKVNAR